MESTTRDCGQILVLGQTGTVDVAHAIDEQIQGTRRGHARVELAQTAGRCVARIDIALLAARQGLSIEAFEPGQRHEHFPAHLEQPRGVGRAQPHGQRCNGLQILRDVLARLPVPTSGTLDENAVLEQRADRQAVELGLRRIADGLVIADAFPYPPVEIAHVLVAEGVVERQHRNAMPHRSERRNRG